MEGMIPCPCCNGYGLTAERIMVYDQGCNWSHDDVIEHRCEECDGTGQIWEECEPAGEEWTHA